jgi:hypothetical protein
MWKAFINDSGYGMFSVRTGVSRLAHRVCWVISGNELPHGMQVLHICDNPACCNPKHLFLGTQRDNIEDMVRKGRNKGSKGVNHPLAKLSEKNVLEIRKLKSDGMSSIEISKMYPVTYQMVDRICNRKAWKHI